MEIEDLDQLIHELEESGSCQQQYVAQTLKELVFKLVNVERKLHTATQLNYDQQGIKTTVFHTMLNMIGYIEGCYSITIDVNPLMATDIANHDSFHVTCRSEIDKLEYAYTIAFSKEELQMPNANLARMFILKSNEAMHKESAKVRLKERLGLSSSGVNNE